MQGAHGGRRIFPRGTAMATKKRRSAGKRVDSDDAPALDREWFERAEIREGERIIRPAKIGRSRRRPRNRRYGSPWKLDSSEPHGPVLRCQLLVAGRSFDHLRNEVIGLGFDIAGQL